MWKASVLAVAAALVSSVNAWGSACSSQMVPNGPSGGASWMNSITRRGSSAFNPDPAGYKPFRNVKSYGAKGDGSTDDSAAITAAISDQNRCGLGCDSSTLSPAIVYFPPGNYVVTKAIIPLYLTQLVGDAVNPPTIIAAASFRGYLIDADPFLPNGGDARWWVNQNNFFKSIRHFKIDLTRVPAVADIVGIHWQVAQATTLVDIVVNMRTEAGNTHKGLFMENGSGGFMADLVFNGGQVGLQVGNQQFTVRNLTVNNAQTAVQTIWAWGWTYQGININNCQTGFAISSGGINIDHQTTGSEVIIDASVTNTATFISTSNSYNGTFAGSILLDNIKFSNVGVGVKDSQGATKLAGGTTTIRQWAQGHVYSGSNGTPSYQQALVANAPAKPAALLNSNGNIFSRGRTDYPNYSASQFASVKAAGAKGDGVTDDTAAIRAFIDKYNGCSILFFDAGTYRVTDTITIPTGSIVVGEVYTTLIGDGANFANQNAPRAVVKVGNPGDKGNTEISDMVFSARSGSAGAIVIEWNTADAAGQKATAAMWDVHIRLGGFAGSGMQVGNCQKLTNHAIAPCTAAFMGIHITQQATAYFEGTWVWTADHDLDDKGQTQIDIYTGRGIVTESANGPVWFIGTASEHADIVQYNFVNVQNVYSGFMQTETAYYQPGPAAPAPFTLNSAYGDPTLTNGPTGWALAIGGNSNQVFVYGGGFYNFFNNYEVTCPLNRSCQVSMIKVASTAKNVFIYGTSTLGATYMLNVDATTVIRASDNANGFQDSFTVWTSSGTGGGSNTVTFSSVSATSTIGSSTIGSPTTTTRATTATSSGPAPTDTSYVGCYTDSGNPRSLTSYSTSSGSMTNPLCISTCSGLGYQYAGTEYASECYCGNTLGGSLDSNDGDCNAPCAGDSSKKCGGSFRLSVYKAGSGGTTPPPPPPPTGPKYVGCYTDSGNPRSLTSYSTSSGSMTNPLCLSTCSGLGYKYAGTEYASECYCGNNLGGSLDSNDGDCNAPCAGDSSKKCGGSFRLSVWTN